MSLVEEEEEYNPNNNYCVHCGLNMGDANDRQLCGKTFCYERIDVLSKASDKKVISFEIKDYFTNDQDSTRNTRAALFDIEIG